MPSASANSGVCVLGVFNVSQTAKECAITECQQASDCCDTPPSGCDSLKASCDSQRDAGVIAADQRLHPVRRALRVRPRAA